MRSSTFGFLAALLGSFAVSPIAQAADLDYGVLRGSDDDYLPAAPVIDWSGFYLGGHGGYGSASIGSKNVLQDPLASYFRSRDIESEFNVSSLLVLPNKRVGGASYGAFIGYNFQFDEIVVGVEADYTRFEHAAAVENGISRFMVTSAGMYEAVNVEGYSKTQIEDYGTVRARVGYAVGNLLPFVTGGFAVGRATVTDQATVQNYGYDQTTYRANQALTTGSPSYVTNHGYSSFNQNYPGNGSTPAGGGVQTVPGPAEVAFARTKTKTVGGLVLGTGLEYAITPSILLRGEYQYVLFNDFDGHKANVNTVRGGAAVKF